MRSFSICFMLLAGMLLTAGCGSGSSITTYPISGTVTFKGEAVPKGSITFVPDTRRDNRGASVSIDIVDGKFDSSTASRGHVGGPHIVRVVGLDGKSGDEFFPDGEMLFPDYEVEMDLPSESSTQTLEVPADLKFPKRRFQLGNGA
ncbi:hypothetical protein ACYFX5_16470 [Bremerella sp. T1]|uniref:hypothetical protein n=1 Tax=Bremerella sp. TYQ1 TaxID=3119568 RepID=UPI001CCA3B61|nr:hypothetical protein [Bremerella volcania]UBM34653.1 hypothetical protein LA756_18420 [Bremerella volcania]